MILQELSTLYDRLVEDPQRGADIPTQGESMQNISFAIILTSTGEFVSFDDIRMPIPKGKKTVMSAQKRKVPGSGERSGTGLNPHFLWDNPSYLLGYKGSGEEKTEKRAQKTFYKLRDKHLNLEQHIKHPHYSAVCRFLKTWTPEKAVALFNPDLLTGNGIFKIQGEESYVHEYTELRTWWLREGQNIWKDTNNKDDDNSNLGMCLITGRREEKIAVLHEPIIKGVANAKAMGAKLVSFNCESFTSYGKKQSINASVSEQAAFAYCNALNYLLARQNNRRMIGDASTVFWADASPAQIEEMNTIFASSIMPPKKLDAPRDAIDNETLSRVQVILQKLAQGKLSKDDLKDMQSRFFILGLSPNDSRLSIRYWFESTFDELMEAIQTHYRDLSLKSHPELISPNAILQETARETKDIPPLFSAALMKAIQGSTPYPDAIAQAILRRISIDKEANYIRCSYLKAWLLRKQTSSLTPIITTMLNDNNIQTGYLIGRLFAAYEKTQLDANPDRTLNKTIRDSFYSSASATPRGVMARLQRLYSHHLAQMDQGAKKNREKLIQNIIGKLTDFPAHMNLEQQAQFTLGYYQQMQNFYPPRTKQE